MGRLVKKKKFVSDYVADTITDVLTTALIAAVVWLVLVCAHQTDQVVPTLSYGAVFLLLIGLRCVAGWISLKS